MHEEHCVERHEGKVIIEQRRGVIPQLLEVDVPQLREGLHQGLHLFLGPPDQELPVGHALAVEALGVQHGRGAGLVAVAHVVGAGPLAGVRSRDVRAHRGDAERARLGGDVAPAGLRAAAEVLVGQLVLQLVVPLDAAGGRVVADRRADAEPLVWAAGWPHRPLLLVDLLGHLRMLNVAVVLAHLPHQPRLLVRAVVLDVHVEHRLGAGALDGGRAAGSELEALVLCLLGPDVLAVDALAGLVVLVRELVHLPVLLQVVRHLHGEEDLLGVLRLAAGVAEALRQHLDGVAANRRLAERLAARGLVDHLPAAVLELGHAHELAGLHALRGGGALEAPLAVAELLVGEQLLLEAVVHVDVARGVGYPAELALVGGRRRKREVDLRREVPPHGVVERHDDRSARWPDLGDAVAKLALVQHLVVQVGGHDPA
mmetsp:Transcript_37647/g.99594  ORF Transcript_37647/g.99594 Transcript_37647/m.99594 type:complete len:428 (+) Transcript_37647:238-1521(+)